MSRPTSALFIGASVISEEMVPPGYTYDAKWATFLSDWQAAQQKTNLNPPFTDLVIGIGIHGSPLGVFHLADVSMTGEGNQRKTLDVKLTEVSTETSGEEVPYTASYIGPTVLKTNLQELTGPQGTLPRIQIMIGGATSGDILNLASMMFPDYENWPTIRSYSEENPDSNYYWRKSPYYKNNNPKINPGDLLYETFAALKQGLPMIQGLCLDNESPIWDQPFMVGLAKLMENINANLGAGSSDYLPMTLTAAPYLNPDTWAGYVQAATTQKFTRFYVQFYGPAGVPSDWTTPLYTPLPSSSSSPPIMSKSAAEEFIVYGVGASSSSPETAAGEIANSGLKGAYLYSYESIPSSNTLADYALAFNQGLTEESD